MASLFIRTVGTSGANALQTVSTVVGYECQLVMVICQYSGVPVQTGVTTTLNSGAGVAYDAVLDTGAANAQTTVFLPTSDIFIARDDVIDVVAPAGGGALTSSIAIYTRPVF